VVVVESVEQSINAILVLGRKGSPYVWPFRSASPETVTSYEHLLRELLSRQNFSSSAAKTKAQENKKDGASVAPELPLKLHRSSSTAVFLMKMELAVMRKPIQASTPRINEVQEAGYSYYESSEINLKTLLNPSNLINARLHENESFHTSLKIQTSAQLSFLLNIPCLF
jgi:hypothetical protein